MIKKTLISAFLMLLVYSFLIMRLAPHLQLSQHHWQENRVRAQNFIYDESDSVHSVIVGTSFSFRMVMDSLKGYYSLSFGGQNGFDGLEILVHKNRLPENVFIETYGVISPGKKEFAASLFNPILFYARKYIPALREGK